MIKKDHIRKRFDEVFDLQMGKTPDRKTLSFFGGDNVWLSIKDMGDKFLSDSNEHITDEAVLSSGIKKVKKGTVVMSFKLTVGKCGIASVDLFTNEAIMAFNVKDGFDIRNDFLYYYLQGYKWEGANKAVMGLTLNKATISKQIIDLPPLAEQEAIVAELDEINETIAELQQQIADLDTLAQSTFYDIFGDPVTNPKGWKVKKWEEVLTIINGKNQKEVENANGKYPICGSGGIMGYADSYLCPEYTTIIGRKGNINNPIYMKEKFWNVDTAFGLVANTDVLMPIYLFFFCGFYDFEVHNVAVTIPSLRKADLLKINIPIPPLALQQEFASRVEAIDEAKAELNAQIAEMQTLLASRMYYYFD